MSAPALPIRDVGAGDLHRTCAICQTPFAPDERLGPCPSCATPFHAECWTENGGCAVYGCRLAPAATAGPTAPASVWGREERDCPACGRRIKMAARRCVHCGGTMAPDAPSGAASAAAVPGRARAVLLFVAGLVPVTAPLALVVGGAWLLSQRRALRRWPTTLRVLAVAGLVAAAAVTLVTAIGLAVHHLTGTGGEE